MPTRDPRQSAPTAAIGPATASDAGRQHEVTALLQQCNDEDAAAQARLLTLVYGELHAMAVGFMRKERSDHTLQATALVHEAYMRLVGGTGNMSFENRRHFYGAAARAMWRVLVNHARGRKATKRDAGVRVPLDELVASYEDGRIEILAWDRALEAIEAIDPPLAQVFLLRSVLELSNAEIADLLRCTQATVKHMYGKARRSIQTSLKAPQP